MMRVWWPGHWWVLSSARIRGAAWALAVLVLAGFQAHAADSGSVITPEAALLRPDPFAGMHAVEMPWIRRLQGWEGQGRLMTVVSDLGPGKPMLAAIGVLLCLAGPRFAGRLAVMLVLCLWGRELLAMILQSPRPYWFGADIRTFRDPPLGTPTFGLPSGHATAAAAVWFFAAAEVRRWWAWAVAVLVVVAVGVSRVYLGVHFISDVLLGTVLGTLGMAGFRAVEPGIRDAWMARSPRHRLGWAVAIGLGLLTVSAVVQVWVMRRVPEGVWAPYGVTARVSSGSVWSAGALCGMALAAVAPVGWVTEGDRWRWRWQRLALAALPAAVYLGRPDEWRLSVVLGDAGTGLKWVVRFLAATVMGWAALGMLPRAVRWLGWVPGSKRASHG